METLHTVARLYAANIIRGMFLSVLTVMLAASVFKQINPGRVAVQGIFIGLLSLIAGYIAHWTKKSIFAKSIKTTTQQ